MKSTQAGISDCHESIFGGPKRGFCQHAPAALHELIRWEFANAGARWLQLYRYQGPWFTPIVSVDHIKNRRSSLKKSLLCFLFLVISFGSIGLYILADMSPTPIKYESDGVQETQHISVGPMWNFFVVFSDALLICFHWTHFSFLPLELLHEVLEMKHRCRWKVFLDTRGPALRATV